MQKIVLFLVVVALAATTGFAGTITAVTGITGNDGSLPNVEGNLPVPSGQTLIATGGHVRLYYAGWSAADLDLLVNGVTVIFDNQTSPLGAVYDLGIFAAGTVLTFELKNITTGVTYYTGPASGNPDNAVHAAYAPWTANSAIPVNGMFIGMEDLSAGGTDWDFNDLMAVVNGAVPTPEPVTLMLVGSSLIAIGLVRRRQRQYQRRC